MRNRSPQALWETALGQLELQVTRPNFETWLRNTVGLRLEGQQLIVGVPSDFALEWLRTRMSGVVNRTVGHLIEDSVTVMFEVLGSRSPDAELPTGKYDAQPSGSPQPSGLDPRLTFDSFLLLKSNRVAYRAAKNVVSGKWAYNPLVLTGPSGVGKTHLLHAIGNAAVAAKRPVTIMTGEGFVDRYGRAVRNGQPHTFRQQFESCEIFLLDEFGFLPARTASLEQFFHLFNTLAQRGCAVVITTDQHPNDTDLPARVRSRIQGGLVADLSMPPADERLDILRAKAAGLKADLPGEVLQLIADTPYETIRELEGALNQVLAFSQIAGKDMTPQLARKALFPLRTSKQPPSQRQILEAVCSYFRVSPEQLAGPSRARDITYPRHVAIYLLRRFGSQPLTDIGHLLGGRDHSTVISAFRRIERELHSIPETLADVQHIERLLTKESA